MSDIAKALRGAGWTAAVILLVVTAVYIVQGEHGRAITTAFAGAAELVVTDWAARAYE